MRAHRLRRRAGRARADARAAARLRQPPHRHATRPSRTRSSTPTGRRRSRSAAPKCTCSSRCRPTASTSTCIRPRPRCASPTSRWSTRSCAAASPTRWARRPCRSCRSGRRTSRRRPGADQASRRRGRPASRLADRWAGAAAGGRARDGADGPRRVAVSRADGATRRHRAWHRPLEPLGQFRDTFIIAVDDEGIVIVDQHVAHERVLFERIMRAAAPTAAREPAAAGADGARPARPGHASAAVARRDAGALRLRRSRISAAPACGSPRCRRCSPRAESTRAAGAGRRPRGPRSRPRRRARPSSGSPRPWPATPRSRRTTR